MEVSEMEVGEVEVEEVVLEVEEQEEVEDGG